jgi:hypothetical protein
MRKIDEINNPNSCFNRALPQELIFVLLERDEAAPIAIQAWIEARVRMGKNAPDDNQTKEARQILEQMLQRRG